MVPKGWSNQSGTYVGTIWCSLSFEGSEVSQSKRLPLVRWVSEAGLNRIICFCGLCSKVLISKNHIH